MEKLQRALNKARADRKAGKPAVADARRASPARRSDATPALRLPAIWENLDPVLLDPELMLRNRVMTLNAQAGAHPFDILRTKIFLAMKQNGWTRLAITSPGVSCGKTTTACNLSVGFSRQREVTCLLLDLDLRRPSVARMLGQTPKGDISELLAGDVPPRDVLMRLRENVAIAMGQKRVLDSTQLLLSDNASSALNMLQEQLEPDIMIFDLPPMLVTDDARAILKHVDCALIVAGAEKTSISQLDVCEREVAEHTNVLGVVLNNCRHLTSDEGSEGSYYY